LAGTNGKHDATRTAVRPRPRTRSVTLGGPGAGEPPRVRAAAGAGELPIASYELFSSTEILGKMAMEKMLAGLSTRRYAVGLEPVASRLPKHPGDKQSAVSAASCDDRNRPGRAAGHEFVRAGLGRIDDRRGALRRSCSLWPSGSASRGVKHPLALVEGSRRTRTLVTDLLVDLRERGLGRHPPDARGDRRFEGPAQGGARRLDHPVIQRCHSTRFGT